MNCLRCGVLIDDDKFGPYCYDCYCYDCKKTLQTEQYNKIQEVFYMHRLDKMDQLIEAINKLTKVIEEKRK